MANKDLDIRMIVEVSASNYGDPYFHVTARPVKHVWDEHSKSWSFRSGFEYDEPRYGDLQVRAQGSLDEDAPSYGWNVEYHQPYRVTRGDAEEMAKVLRKIERGVEKMTADLGYAENIGQYIARVAKVLGITSFGMFPPKGEALWSSGERVRWDNASHLNWQIEQRVVELRTQHANH